MSMPTTWDKGLWLAKSLISSELVAVKAWSQTHIAHVPESS